MVFLLNFVFCLSVTTTRDSDLSEYNYQHSTSVGNIECSPSWTSLLVLAHMQQYVIYRIKCHVNVLTLINAIINMFQVSQRLICVTGKWFTIMCLLPM